MWYMWYMYHTIILFCLVFVYIAGVYKEAMDTEDLKCLFEEISEDSDRHVSKILEMAHCCCGSE